MIGSAGYPEPVVVLFFCSFWRKASVVGEGGVEEGEREGEVEGVEKDFSSKVHDFISPGGKESEKKLCS